LDEPAVGDDVPLTEEDWASLVALEPLLDEDPEMLTATG